MKRIALCFLLLLVPSSLAHAADDPSDQTPAWKACAASVVITPQRPLQMAGYGGRKEPAEGTEQDLFAKALAIEKE